MIGNILHLFLHYLSLVSILGFVKYGLITFLALYLSYLLCLWHKAFWTLLSCHCSCVCRKLFVWMLFCNSKLPLCNAVFNIQRSVVTPFENPLLPYMSGFCLQKMRWCSKNNQMTSTENSGYTVGWVSFQSIWEKVSMNILKWPVIWVSYLMRLL